MDFIYGILLIVIIIFILINFASVSISDNIGSYNMTSSQPNMLQTLFSIPYDTTNMNSMNSMNSVSNLTKPYNIPLPTLSATSSKNSISNNKLNLNTQQYNYSKLFFM